MRVLICSKVRRASSRTSVEGTEVVRVVIVKGDYFSVFPQAFLPELCNNCIKKDEKRRLKFVERKMPLTGVR